MKENVKRGFERQAQPQLITCPRAHTHTQPERGGEGETYRQTVRQREENHTQCEKTVKTFEKIVEQRH